MRYGERLSWGVLRRREKRFTAEVELPDGRTVSAHVPNSGRMTGCSAPGSPCLIAPAKRPERKLRWTLEQVVSGGVVVGVNTARANRLAAEALRAGVVVPAGLNGSFDLRAEVPLGERSRIDFRLEDAHGPYWLEVKSVTWTEGKMARFPDAVTARGLRHLDELIARVAAGDRAGLLFVVQRGDAVAVTTAGEVDPAYATRLREARSLGVALHAVQIAIGPGGLLPVRELPVRL